MEGQRAAKVGWMANYRNASRSKTPVRLVQLVLVVDIESDVEARWVMRVLTVSLRTEGKSKIVLV
jgi:hypothetical protein